MTFTLFSIPSRLPVFQETFLEISLTTFGHFGGLDLGVKEAFIGLASFYHVPPLLQSLWQAAEVNKEEKIPTPICRGVTCQCTQRNTKVNTQLGNLRGAMEEL